MNHRSVSIARLVGLAAPAAYLLSAQLVAAAGRPTDEQAKRILAATGVRGGLIVLVNCGDPGAPRLAAALGAAGPYLVEALDTDAKNVAEARRHLVSLSLHGKVTANRYDGRSLPYAQNLVGLVVSADLGDVSMAEVMRVLRPGGAAYVRSDGKWQKAVKPWPTGMDEWTHFLHGADGNAVGRDVLIGPPRHVQWMAGPVWARHHDTVPSVNALVSAGGRIFYVVDEAPACIAGPVGDRWFLAARDAFSGVLLWKRPMALWGWKAWSGTWKGRFNQPNHVPKRLVAAGNRLYVTLGFNAPLSALDAASGQVVKTYKATEYTDEILAHRGKLILSINHGPQKPGKAAEKPPVRKSVVALDPVTGRVLWKTGSYVGTSSKTGTVERVSHLLLAARADGVYLADTEGIVALDLATGRRRWRAPRPEHKRYTSRYAHLMSDLCTLVATDDVVLFAQLEPIQKRIGWGVIKTGLYAFSTKDGRMRWSRVVGNWGHFCVPDVFVIGGRVWVHDYKTVAMIALDPANGERRRSISTAKWFKQGHHHRCYRNKAAGRYILTGYRGVEFLDVQAATHTAHHWTRGGCRYGILPCNGLLYSTPHPCSCYIKAKLNGLYALAPALAEARRAKPANRGNPQSTIRNPQSRNPQSTIRNPQSRSPQSRDWPTYRHNAARSGATPTRVATALRPAWTVKIGPPLSPPVVADGRLLVSAIDTHTVHALDARTGKRLWHRAVGGRVDSPPTVHDGLVLFGCADGWVYALRASDGEEAWRLRAAPGDRRIVSFGRLESTWPVHGSVLVRDGVVYFAAGRSSYLDGGIRTLSARAEDGKVLSSQRIYSPDPQTGLQPPQKSPHELPGALPDILVAGKAGVTMRHLRIDTAGKPATRPAGGLHLLCTGGFLDDSWFNRIQWIYGAAAGQLLVFDRRTAYGVRAYPQARRWQFFHPGKGYVLFAADPRDRSRKTKKNPHPADRWSVRVPIRARAMVLTGPPDGTRGGRTLFIAGCPDKLDPKEPWAAFEGRRGGQLWAVSTKDGCKLSECALPAPPVFDGLIAADRRLYLSTLHGSVMCLQGVERSRPAAGETE